MGRIWRGGNTRARYLRDVFPARSLRRWRARAGRPVPAANPWLEAMPEPCIVCEVRDHGKDWLQWRDVWGHTYTAHVTCFRRPLQAMRRRQRQEGLRG